MERDMGLNEDQLLSRIAVQQLLAGLSEADRCMMLLIFQIALPSDWGQRALTYTEIGDYVGQKYEGAALAESTVRYRRNEIMRMLRGERGGLRRGHQGKVARPKRAKPAKSKPKNTPKNDV